MSKPTGLDLKAIKKPDAFVRTGRSFFQWLTGHRSRFLSILGVGALIVGGVYFYDGYAQKKLRASWKDYFLATKKPEAEKWAQFEKVHESHSNNRAGFLAAVDLADHYFEESKIAFNKKAAFKDPSDKAIHWYSKALDFSDLLPLEKQLLLINRAKTYELQQTWDKAIADFQSAEALSGEAKGLALLGVGRVQEKQNLLDAARTTYQKLSQEYGNTEYGRLARRYLRVMKGSQGAR